MIKAIIFDFDDTLVQTKAIRFDALKLAGKRFYNLDITDKDINALWGKPFHEFIKKLYKNSSSVEELTKSYKSVIHEFPLKLYPHTKTVLHDLSNNFILGIVSTGAYDLVIDGLKDVHISKELFFHIQSAEHTSKHKPDPAVFIPTIKALKKFKIKKNEVLYVGDTLDDYYSATNIGFYFCAIADRTTDQIEFNKVNSLSITDIKDLTEFIRRLST